MLKNRKFKKISMWVIGAALMALLIGSFPLRHIYGVIISDIARIAGFVLMIPFLIIKANLKKK